MKSPILPARQQVEIPKRKKNLTLGEYVERFLSSRDVTQHHQESTRTRIASFIRWFGRDPFIAELECDIVNEWLSALLTTELRPATVQGYRRSIRSVWWYAYQEGDNDNPPLRLKKIRVPQQTIEAFTQTEITKMLQAAAGLKGFFEGNGLRRSEFWTAVILAAYSTGLRRADLLQVTKSQIAEDGTAVIVQNKTGYRVCVRFSPDAMAAIAKLKCDDERALPWPYHENSLSIYFRRTLKNAAGITRGSFRWLRRSAASYAEAQQAGAGSRMLGHRSAAVFNAHYNDETITVARPTAPPNLPTIVSVSTVSTRDRKGRLPPTVRLAKVHGARTFALIFRDATGKEKYVSTKTKDEAKAMEMKASLEEQLRSAVEQQ